MNPYNERDVRSSGFMRVFYLTNIYIMSNVYLKSGEEVVLHSKLETGEFLVEMMMTYFGHEGDEYEEPCGVKQVVSEVFKEVPTAKKHKDLIEIIKKTEAKNKELSNVEEQLRKSTVEINRIKNQKTELDKFIINRKELIDADSLTVFDGFKARTLSSTRDLKLSFQIKIYDGETNGWGSTIWEEGRDGMSFNFNKEIGILVDATDDEVLEIGKRLVLESSEISDWDLDRINEDYLTDELLDRKNKILENKRINDVDSVKAEIETKKKELAILQKKVK